MAVTKRVISKFMEPYGEIMGASGSVCHNPITLVEIRFEDRLRQLNL